MMAPTSACPDEETVLQFVEGRLRDDLVTRLESHVRGCCECMDLVGAAAGLVDAIPSPDGAIVPVTRPGALAESGGRPGPLLAGGMSVGRYVILQPVGHGGMGEVYSAHDPELDRKIAIKVIRGDSVPTADQSAARARLLREARAIARVSHPNVVAVFDAGTVDGRVFLAMEFVEGRTLAQTLANLPAGPERWRSVLALFVAAGRGLAAAHAARIVHRDFKPQNVMVGVDGQVRVTDFGLASESSGTGPPGSPVASTPEAMTNFLHRPIARPLTVGLTRTGTLLGTPAYMAPEQFLGQPVDARADQFSFCLALYEALYGVRPFAAATLPELMEAVTTGKIAPGSDAASVPSWVRKIVLRGLRSNRDDRFESMPALLAALVTDPARRRRPRALAATVTLLLGVVVIATVAMTARTSGRAQAMCRAPADRLLQVWDLPGGPLAGGRTTSRRQMAYQSFLATGRDFAPDTWNRVAAMLDDYASRWAAAYTDACEATHVRGQQSAETLGLRMSCLDEHLRTFGMLTTLLSGADAAVVVGATDAARALPELHQCSDLNGLRARVPPPRDATTRAKVEDLRGNLAELKILQQAGRARGALQRARAVVTKARSVGDPHLLVESLERLVELQIRAGDLADAEVTGTQALWMAVGIGRDDIALSISRQLYEVVSGMLVRFRDGEVWDQMTEALLTRLGPGHDLEWSWIWNDRGVILTKQQRFPEALALLEKARVLKEKILGPDHPDVGITLSSMATAHLEMGDLDAALRVSDAALDRVAHAYGPEHPALARLLINCAEARLRLGAFDEALTRYRRSLQLWQPEIGNDNALMGYPLTGIGLSLLGKGDVEGAVTSLQRALAVREAGEADPIPLAEARFGLAQALWVQGNRARATLLAKQARDAYGGAVGSTRQLQDVDVWLAKHPGKRNRVRAF